MSSYGYARVSTDGQDVAMQVAALRKAGVSAVFEETRSGALHLPELEALVSRLRKGDELVVYKVDRLARSLRVLLALQDRLSSLGVSLRSLTEPIDTGTPIGRAFFQLLGVLAELERALIRERCAAGREAALSRGVRFGRAPALSVADLQALAGEGLSISQAARAVGLSQSHVSRLAVRHGGSFAVFAKGRRADWAR